MVRATGVDAHHHEWRDGSELDAELEMGAGQKHSQMLVAIGLFSLFILRFMCAEYAYDFL